MSRYLEITETAARILIPAVIVSVCMQCGRRYRETPDPAGLGGDSHGLCGDECDAAYRAERGFPPKARIPGMERG